MSVLVPAFGLVSRSLFPHVSVEVVSSSFLHQPQERENAITLAGVYVFEVDDNGDPVDQQ